MNYSCEHY